MNKKELGSGDSGLETGISYLLIVGVIASLVLEIAGLILMYVNYHTMTTSQDPSVFIHGTNFFTFMLLEFQGKNSPDLGLRLLTIGIIVLIATPFIRLIASVVYFGWEKNWKYVVITLFVLIVITLSLILH